MTPSPDRRNLSRAELEALVKAKLAEGFVSSAILALVLANQDAHKLCATFAKPERRDSFGHVQRGLFEKRLRHAASDIDGATARVRRNHKKTSSFTEVHMNGLVITASAVQAPYKLPRGAEFRNTRARSSQRLLFALDSGVPLAANDDASDHAELLFGVLTHCQNQDGILYDARIVIPDHTGRHLLGSLDLNDQLRAALASANEESPEEQVQEPQPGVIAAAATKKEA